MPIEKHMLQTHSLFEKAGEVLEGVAELKKRLSSIQSDKMQLEDDNALLRRNNAELKAENRRLKRALWLARANRALEKIALFKLWNASISTMNPEDGAKQEYDKWKKNLGKFLKKAEEYK